MTAQIGNKHLGTYANFMSCDFNNSLGLVWGGGVRDGEREKRVCVRVCPSL